MAATRSAWSRVGSFGCNVRSTPKADVAESKADVCFVPKVDVAFRSFAVARGSARNANTCDAIAQTFLCARGPR